MVGRRIIQAILVCAIMTMLPIATIADEENGNKAIPLWDYWWSTPGHFDYNDGKAFGYHMSFEVNEGNGMVTNYTVTLSTFDLFNPRLTECEVAYIDRNGEIITEPIYLEYNLTFENVTVFDSIEVEGFSPVGYPGTFADLFVFQGENALIMFYDTDWSQGYYASGDVENTIIFKVAEGSEILQYPYYWYDVWGYDEKKWEEDPDYIPDDFYLQPYSEIWIESNNATTTIWINEGNATIDNNTITVQLKANGYLNINTWSNMPFFPTLEEVWYYEPDLKEEMELIERGREEGFIAGEGWYFEIEGYQEQVGNNFNFNFYGDPTFNMDLIKIGDERFDVLVDSQIPEGRIVTINLNKDALDAESIDNLLVKLDGNEIEHTATLEELMELVGSSKAKYFALFSEEGTTVFVYVPHFSTHTITLESILGTSIDILVPAVLALVVIAVAASVILMRGRKDKDEF